MNASLVVRRVGVALALTMTPRLALTQDVVPAAIDTFVTAHARDAGDTLPAPPRIVGQVDAPPVTLFVSGRRIGVSAGSRIGWLRFVATAHGINRVADTLIGPSWFDLGPDDGAITRTAVTMTVAPADSSPLRVWRTCVAGSPVTPLSTLQALLRVDSTLGPSVAMSPRLLSTRSAWHRLIALADADDRVAAVVLTNPDAPHHPRDLVLLARRRPGVWDRAMRIVLSNLPALVASGPIDDRLAVDLATAAWHSPDSIRRAVAALPAVRRSKTAPLILAVAADTNRRVPFQVDTGRLGALIARIQGDTSSQRFFPQALGTALAYASDIQADHRLLRALASLNGHAAGERWRPVRLAALQSLLYRARETDDLEFVARQLADSSYWHHNLDHAPYYFAGSSGQIPPRRPIRGAANDTLLFANAPVRSQEGMVAQRLLQKTSIWSDRPALESLAGLPADEFGGVPFMAKRYLQLLDRRR